MSARIARKRLHGPESQRLALSAPIPDDEGGLRLLPRGGLLMAWVEPIARVLEGAGVIIIVIGAVVSTGSFAVAAIREARFEQVFTRYRANLGRGILLGLEFLIAGDIIATILVEPTLESVGSLGLIVLIRTFLSFSLEAEIEGQLPWRRREKGTS